MAEIRELAQGDLPAIAATQGGPAWHGAWDHWPRYLAEHQSGERTVLMVEDGAAIVGYGSLVWVSQYPPFAAEQIPEIQDMVVAESRRGRGHGRAMIAAFEALAVGKGCNALGIGFGLYADYGAAQHLYVSQGFVPDGRGLTYDNQPVAPGSSVRVDDDLVLWLTKRLS
ncbi:MAG: GNAT family N-acetyltransferase [Caulobacterales bacterium]